MCCSSECGSKLKEKSKYSNGITFSQYIFDEVSHLTGDPNPRIASIATEVIIGQEARAKLNLKGSDPISKQKTKRDSTSPKIKSNPLNKLTTDNCTEILSQIMMGSM